MVVIPEPWYPYRIQRLRQALVLNLEEMGKAVGVNAATIYRWEKGQRKPRARHCRKMAQLEAKLLVPKA